MRFVAEYKRTRTYSVLIKAFLYMARHAEWKMALPTKPGNDDTAFRNELCLMQEASHIIIIILNMLCLWPLCEGRPTPLCDRRTTQKWPSHTFENVPSAICCKNISLHSGMLDQKKLTTNGAHGHANMYLLNSYFLLLSPPDGRASECWKEFRWHLGMDACMRCHVLQMNRFESKW